MGTFCSIRHYSFPVRDQSKAATIHMSTHPRSIAKEDAAGKIRSSSASDYSKYTKTNYTCAQAAEVVVTHRSSGKMKKSSKPAPDAPNPRQLSSAVGQKTDPALVRVATGAGGLEWHCPIDSCPKKSVSSENGREFLRHIYDCHRAQFPCSTPWCVFFAEGNERICPACYDQHPRLKEARVSSKKWDHNRTVVLQGSEPPPPPNKRISAGGLPERISKLGPLPEIPKQSPPVAADTLSCETTHLDAMEVICEADDGESDCGHPECVDSGQVPGEEELKRYLRAFVRDKAADFCSIMQWAKDRSSRGADSDQASAKTWLSGSTDTSGGSNRRDSNNSGALKRGYKDRDSYIPDDQEDNDPKKPRTSSITSSTTNSHRWACPYDKRELSRPGSNRGYNACTLRGFKCIHNVKEHLYRRHLVYQCERCGHEFLTREEHTSHVRAIVPCELKELQNSEGITEKKKEKLKSKGGLPKTRVGQWNLIYQILFPGAPVPNPYQGEVHPTRESSLSNISRESFGGEAFGNAGEQFPQLSQELAEHPTQGTGPNPATQGLYTRSRDSDDFQRMEETLGGRLLDRVCSMLESRLPDTILDARDSIIEEEGQLAFLDAQSRASLPPVDEASFYHSLIPRPLAPGWHAAQDMSYAVNDYTPIPACFSVPPPQDPSVQGPNLDQARDIILSRPNASFSDSAYYSAELVPDSHRPSHETPSIEIARMNDGIIDGIPTVSQDDVPFHQYCINSGERDPFS